MGEQRAVAEVKGIAGAVEHGYAGDVGGQQVGGKLDAAKRQDVGVRVFRVVRDYGLSQCLGQGCLARSREILQQYMAIGHQGDDGEFDDIVPAQHLPTHHGLELVQEVYRAGEFRFVRLRNSFGFDNILSGCFSQGFGCHWVLQVFGSSV